MKLFEDKDRKHNEPSNHNENLYDYYDRSARKDVSKMRDVLNEWFSNYPQSERVELKQRFKKVFSSAFYELCLFNLFKRQGFDIETHPLVPNSNKRPDFLISKQGIELYLEAKVAKGESKQQESHKKRINQIYDSLNTIKSPNFLLNVEELTLKSNIPSTTKQIRSIIETQLKNFDPDIVSSDIQKNGFDVSPRISMEDDNLILILSLIPKDKEFRSFAGRPIAVYPIETFWGWDEDSIKNSFAKKAKRYGQLNKPYIICINSIGSRFSGDYDVMNAVWGTQALWDDKLVRLKDGLFLSDRGPVFQNVSGVLITYIMEFNIPVSKYWFIKHPFSNYDLDFEIFDMTYQYVKDKHINTQKEKTIGQIFNINSNWLDE